MKQGYNARLYLKMMLNIEGNEGNYIYYTWFGT
jgi:hypothetical protein